MNNRFSDALSIQQGASNPMGVTNALLRAMKECQDIEHDPACRLICHQLAFLLAVHKLDDIGEYDKAMTYCEENAK